MTVGDARDAARQWVSLHGPEVKGFVGAFTHGSTNWLHPEEPFPPTSDLDLIVVIDTAEQASRVGKRLYRGVILDVSYMPVGAFGAPDQVLANSHVAESFARSAVLSDPSGWLCRLQQEVGRSYREHGWVRRRCEAATERMAGYLRAAEQPGPCSDRVLAWLFGVGLTTHVLLIAGLRNPTVRSRFAAVRQLLADYHREELHPALLQLLGSHEWTTEQAQRHVSSLGPVFDAAAAACRTPFPFSSDISEAARPTELGGSRELVAKGLHREAAFWIAVTHSRCQSVLREEASPEVRESCGSSYQELLSDLGLQGPKDLGRRIELVRLSLPRLSRAVEGILTENPEIVG
ncbi:MAG TPA: hypothetical protein VGN26_07435 [Armatimonadota bacterium]